MIQLYIYKYPFSSKLFNSYHKLVKDVGEILVMADQQINLGKIFIVLNDRKKGSQTSSAIYNNGFVINK